MSVFKLYQKQNFNMFITKYLECRHKYDIIFKMKRNTEFTETQSLKSTATTLRVTKVWVLTGTGW